MFDFLNLDLKDLKTLLMGAGSVSSVLGVYSPEGFKQQEKEIAEAQIEASKAETKAEVLTESASKAEDKVQVLNDKADSLKAEADAIAAEIVTSKEQEQELINKPAKDYNSMTAEEIDEQLKLRGF